jgi:stress-induced morphogen
MLLPHSFVTLSLRRSLMSTMTGTVDIVVGPIGKAIESKLISAFSPIHHMEVRNESYMHNVPTGSETHFKVIIVSEKFSSVKTPIGRHRLVNDVLKDEESGQLPVHALSIVAMTPDKWQERLSKEGGNSDAVVGPSPPCRGGDGSLPPKKNVK